MQNLQVNIPSVKKDRTRFPSFECGGPLEAFPHQLESAPPSWKVGGGHITALCGRPMDRMQKRD